MPKSAHAQKTTFIQTLTSFVAGTMLKLLAWTLRVKWTDGGTFYVSKRQARAGRNPRTGEALKIAAAKVPKFRAGKALKDAIN